MTHYTRRCKNAFRKGKLCPKLLCHLRGSPQSEGTIREHEAPNTIENQILRRENKLDESIT